VGVFTHSLNFCIMEFKIWLAYLLTEFLVDITPGPAVMLVTTQGVKYGAKSSLFGALGITSANLIYFLLSALGLSTLILNAGNLFEYIKIAGAIYLVYAGASMLYSSFKRNATVTSSIELRQNKVRSYFQGFITQVANPKAIIYFIALLPQFVDPSGNIAIQFIILSVTSIVVEIFILMFYGWLGARGKRLAGQNQIFTKWQDRVAGTVLIGIGINLFFIKRIF